MRGRWRLATAGRARARRTPEVPRRVVVAMARRMIEAEEDHSPASRWREEGSMLRKEVPKRSRDSGQTEKKEEEGSSEGGGWVEDGSVGGGRRYRR